MEKILSVYKPIGMTPLQLIGKLREQNPEFKDITIGYAGRLDPLAHGIMLLTVGEENKNRQQYLNLSKTYKFSVLYGVKTDSYDYLGFLENFQISTVPVNLKEMISDFTRNHTRPFTQPYPPFSSKTINGIQLYKLAKKGQLNKDSLPVRSVEIFKFGLESLETISSSEIEKIILKNLRKIRGHFRQKKTIELWKKLFASNKDYNFTLGHFELECSSGTYVRSLANKMGEEFGCGSIAFEILRTKVGDFDIKNAFKIDT